MSGLYIPKALQGADFVGVERHEHYTCLVFRTPRTEYEGGVIRVVMRFTGEPLFAYSVYDPESQTIVHYEGKHGDPEKDRRIEMKGVG